MDIKPKMRRASTQPPETRLAAPESSATSVVVRPSVSFDSVKVFAATRFTDRTNLGEVVTHWIAQHPEYEITEIMVRQSSDSEFHCLTLIVFYRTRP